MIKAIIKAIKGDYLDYFTRVLIIIPGIVMIVKPLDSASTHTIVWLLCIAIGLMVLNKLLSNIIKKEKTHTTLGVKK